MTKLMKTAVLAALLAAGAAGTATAADKIRILKSAAVCICFLPADLGNELGTWKKYGIEVEIGSAGGEAKVQQAMVSDSVDVALGSGAGLALVSKGVPAKAVGVIVHGPAGMSLIVPNDSPIKSEADLKGKKIGVTTGGSLTDWLARKAMEKGGLGKGDAQILPLGDLSSNLAALNSGSSDALVYGSEAGYSLEVEGKHKVLLTFDKVVPTFITNVVFITDKNIKERPDVVRKFVTGWYEIVTWMKAHPKETGEFADKTLKLKPGVGEKVMQVLGPELAADGKFRDKELEVLNQSYVDLGILPAKIDLSKVIDTQFLPK